MGALRAARYRAAAMTSLLRFLSATAIAAMLAACATQPAAPDGQRAPDAQPGTAAAPNAPPAVTSPEAMALVEKVENFVGGKAKIDAVNAMRTVATATRQTPQGPMEMEVDSTVVFPNRQRAVMKTPMGEVTMVMTPDQSFTVIPGMGVRETPSSQRDAAIRESRQELLSILKNPSQYTFAIAGNENVNGVNATVVDVTFAGDTVKWYVDPSTGKLLRRVARARGPMMQGDAVTDFTAWGTFGGLQLPTAFSTTVNGQPVGGGQVKTIEINPTIDPKIWEKPAS